LAEKILERRIRDDPPGTTAVREGLDYETSLLEPTQLGNRLDDLSPRHLGDSVRGEGLPSVRQGTKRSRPSFAPEERNYARIDPRHHRWEK